MLLADRLTVRCHPLCVREFKVFINDAAQRREMRDFLSRCRPGMQLLDVGAHWGAFTLAALTRQGRSARALCIEASTSAAVMLRKNLGFNGLESLADVIVAAAGSKPGVLKMLTTGAGGADYVIVPAEDRPDTTPVPQVTVDEVCRERGFNPTHVKIDVEGFEEEVLMGAGETLSNLNALLFLELHGDFIRARGGNPLAPLHLAASYGYRSIMLEGVATDLDGVAAVGCNARLVLQKNATG